MSTAVVLFAHGSRDPEWSRPLKRLAEELQRRSSGLRIELAFLEHGQALAEAAASLAAQGIGVVRVVPVFLGMGGHLKRDLPAMVEQLRHAFPALHIVVEPPVGERPEVIAAIARSIGGIS